MEEIKKTIRELIEQYTGVWVGEDDKNFFEYEINMLDLLYVVRDMEEKFGVTARKMFADADYHIFDINHISKKIMEVPGN